MSISIVDQIVKTEKLTRNILLREVLPEHNESIYFREKKKELLSDLGSIASRYDLEERLIIYCFIRLWKEGRVLNFNFWESFNENRIDVASDYIKHYYDNLRESQEILWQE